MERPFCHLTVTKAVTLQEKDYTLRLSYQNIDKCEVSIYRVTNYKELSPYNYVDPKKEQKVLAKRMQIKLPNSSRLYIKDTLITLPNLPEGVYSYTIDRPKAESYSNYEKFIVTSQQSLHKLIGKKKDTLEIFVTDRITGKPLKDVEINLYQYSHQNNRSSLINTQKSNQQGLLYLPIPKDTRQNLYYTMRSKKEDELYKHMIYYTHYTQPQNNATQVDLYTDRGIYRPGQTIYFKGIAHTLKEVLTEQEYTVVLYDVNRQEVNKQTYKTNRFGSFSGSFTIPNGRLNGYYSLSVNGHTEKSVKVEEYKRPTFEIQFDSIRQSYQLGDQVEISGKIMSFNGIPIQASRVNYSITRSTHNPYLWYKRWYNSPNQELGNGQINLSDDGSFSFTFTAQQPENNDFGYGAIHLFTVTLAATDNNGETQTQSQALTLSNRSLILSIEGEEKVTGYTPFRFTAVNLQNNAVDISGKWILYALNDYVSIESLQSNDTLSIAQEIKRGFCQFNQTNSISFDCLPAGRYRLRVESKDLQGRPVHCEKDLILYNPNGSKLPALCEKWISPHKDQYSVGETVQIGFGTSYKNAYCLYELFDQNSQCLTRHIYKISNECKYISIPFLEEFGKGVIAQFTFIKNGTTYYEEVPIQRKETNQKIETTLTTFRDKLTPGETEEWTLHLTNNGEPLTQAELLAAMYDQSLDQLGDNTWGHVTLSDYLKHVAAPQWYPNPYSYQVGISVPFPYSYSYHWQSPFNLNWMELNYLINRNPLRFAAFGGVAPTALKEARVRSLKTAAKEEMEAVVEDCVAESANSVNTRTNSENAPATVRKNLQETAFFYPHLYTNDQGDVTLQFKVPESLTRWMFKTVAHTADLKYGEFTSSCITQKELMVTPNLPRYLREKDQMTFSAKINNLTTQKQTVTVLLELFDPFTEKVYSKWNQKKVITLPEQGNNVCQWEINTLPEDAKLIGVRISAQNSHFNDGEQHVLPILSSKQLVTEAQPFTLREQGSHTFKLTAPDRSAASPYRMVLEYASNSLEYALQSLPSLQINDSENTLNILANYYSAIVSQSILQANPQIKELILQWSKEANNETTLSTLEKNAELKSVLLQETPWVVEAGNETDRKRELVQLLNQNNLQDKITRCIQLLQGMQNADGGWAWYPGMRSNTYITQTILTLMDRILQLNQYQFGEAERMMQIKALNYCDQQIIEEYEREKTQETKKQSTIGLSQIAYLYTRSGYRDIPIAGESQEAFNHYMEKLSTYQPTTKSLYTKAVAAITLHRYGYKNQSLLLLKSLREYATHSNELGMYWENNVNQAHWSENKIATQSMLIQAFTEIDPKTAELNEMKVWLLKQKQTQAWENTIATIEAIAALTNQGVIFTSENSSTQIKWGKHHIELSPATGSSYIKLTLENNDLADAGLNTVTITKTGNALGWGALYYQHFEEMDQTKQSKNPLLIKRNFLLETHDQNGTQLKPLQESDLLKPGDKLVTRFIVQVDRDMEFVHLKGLHPSCCEPVQQSSHYGYENGVGYYLSNKDASINYFFDVLPKGSYIFEHSSYVTREGVYIAGPATIQCIHAPEFISHTESYKLIIKNN